MSTKRKLPQKLGQPVLKQSAKVLGKSSLDESKTLVSGGGNAIKSNGKASPDVVDISSDSSGEDDSEADDESAEEESAAGEDVAMEDAESAADEPPAEETEEAGEPSFGDLVRANISEPIDVAGAFQDAKTQAVPYPKPQIQTPSGASLGTVLAQALRTNDVSLLESCLHTTDVNIIRATIQRLESPLAGRLIARLADRLHKRPGRAGSLMVWVQWTLVTHGGFLATQPDLVQKLAVLNQVIDARSRGLQSVLSLKGKLDMLESQIELRRSLQNQRRRIDEDDEEDGVIYVEGQESEEEEEAAKVQRLAGNDGLGLDSDGESEDMPLKNGVVADSDDEDDSSEDDLIDDEAEETDNDSGDEDEVDYDDQDSMDEDESDDGVQAAPPPKMAKIGGQFSKKR